MTLKRLIISMVAAAGLGGHHSAAQVSPVTQARQLAAIKNSQSTRSIEADMLGSYASGLGLGFMRSPGHTPYEWGISRACAQMRRQNRMRAAGIRGSRI